MNGFVRVLIAVLSAGLVLLLVLLDMGQTGPGKLTAVHAQVVELRGQEGCVLCHGGGPAELAASCMECHEEIKEQAQLSRGIHGELDAQVLRGCGTCHPEHLGKQGALLTEASFALAGHPGPAGFGHGSVAFDLHGRHDSLDCVDCHPLANEEVLPEGQSRYLGQVQQCISCHDDPHEGAMKRGCEDCHGQMHDFDDLTHFDHVERFPLHASHAGHACVDCHEADSAYSVAALSDPTVEPAWRSCAACHESPHQEAFLTKLLAMGEPLPEGGQCASCHSEQHQNFFDPAVTLSVAQHEASGFSLTRPHADLECTACHDGNHELPFAERFPGRMAERCAECHDDPHGGQFAHDPYLERGCLSCHAAVRFHPHGFGMSEHAETAFALTGSHAEASCESCHTEVIDQVRQFAGSPLACEACHQDVHDGAFDAHLATLGPLSASGSCALCHDSTRFADVHAEFDHALWTGYALNGAHDPLDCEACHHRSQRADPQGRSFGRVAELYPGDPASCAPCHQDVHGGLFDRPGVPDLVTGKRGCARCHTEDAFHAASDPPFDHGLWAGFVLDGAHAQSSCESCHGAGADTRLGKVADLFAGDPSRCVTCHLDPHHGSFGHQSLPQQVDGQSDCARCHSTGSFRMAASGFDHAQWARFALDGQHATLSCAACHPKQHPAGPRGRRTQRAAGTDCASCHVDVHFGQFAKAGRTDCASCHSTEHEAFRITDFDHNTQTQFRLDEDHARLDCSACHQEASMQDGRRAVRYKPLGTDCADCHTAGGGR